MFNLHRISAILLAIGTLGHTFGGMLDTSRHGPHDTPEADAVLASMKAVHFRWRGAECTWHKFLMGNGLGVTALLLLAIAAAWWLGGLPPNERPMALPIAWAAAASIALLCVLGFVYFTPFVGCAFGVTALLLAIAAARWTWNQSVT